MKRENLFWVVVFLIGAVLVGANMIRTSGDMAKSYVRDKPMEFVNTGTTAAPNWVNLASDEGSALAGQTPEISWVGEEAVSVNKYLTAVADNPGQAELRLSRSRTLGVWVAALFTLFIFSFLFRDNPLYKIAESVVVGVSAAYWMVVGFWDTIVPNLFAKLAPGAVQGWAMPGLADAERELIYLIPLILGGMLLWRLAPKGGWISRWPMAFIIGVFCGLRLISFLHADFLSQIRASITPLWVVDAAGNFNFGDSLRAVILVIGVLTCLVYFFFSIEHKGAVGGAARVGIWFLMITFGAAFGYTVMGRIALLAIRIEFLVDDWLWLIDPKDLRVMDEAVAMLGMGIF